MSELKQRTVSASFLDTLLDAFASVGVPRSYLLEQAGVAVSAFDQPDNRLPVETVTEIWVAAKEKSTNSLLGLQVGEHIRPGSFSVLGHLLMTEATLGEALTSATRFAVLVGDGGRLSVSMDQGNAVLSYDLVDQNIPCREERIEAVIASLVGFSRWITGREILPLNVEFMHAPLGRGDAYEDYFLLKPVFGGASNRVTFSKVDLQIPLVQSNPELSAVLGGHAERVLSRITSTPPFLLNLRQAMRQNMQEGGVELEAVADLLSMTPRSLQRKLAELDTTFQYQVNELRQAWAIEQMRNGDKSIGEIAYQLGFSDPASFNRAFKRWTGMPPGKWLKEKSPEPEKG